MRRANHKATICICCHVISILIIIIIIIIKIVVIIISVLFVQPPGERPGKVASLSIVLPCANEGEFVQRSVESVFAATPEGVLKEIIVVDDASTPPVASDLGADFLAAHRARSTAKIPTYTPSI